MSDPSARRVVITGMGLISPLGNSPESLWHALAAGQSGVRPLVSVPTEFLPTSFAGEARDFQGEIENFGPLERTLQRNIKKGLKLMCREIEMGVAAAQLALSHAGHKAGSYDPDRTGCVYGCDHIMTMPEEFADGVTACLDSEHKFQFSRWGETGLSKMNPLWLLKYLPNMPGSHIAIYNELRGPSNTITLREAAGNLSIGEAASTISRGAADIIVAGATGTRIHPLRILHILLQEEVAGGNIDPAKASRPFDFHRTGMVLGEGSGAVVLEELKTAQARGATILGEVVGHGASSALDEKSVANYELAIKNVLLQSLRTANMKPEEIGHLHAHGLATRICDAAESRAIDQVFGQRNKPVPVISAKSYFGNLGAGGGVVELISSVLALNQGRLFRTLNYETPDPECAISVCTSNEAPAGDSFINVSVTPQGQASAVAVRKLA